MTQHLQIHEPVCQACEHRAQKTQQEQGSAQLQFVVHPKNGQPPVAIGSSPDGVTSGGQNYFSLLRQIHRRPPGKLSRWYFLNRWQIIQAHHLPRLRGLQAQVQLPRPFVNHHRRM